MVLDVGKNCKQCFRIYSSNYHLAKRLSSLIFGLGSFLKEWHKSGTNNKNGTWMIITLTREKQVVNAKKMLVHLTSIK